MAKRSRSRAATFFALLAKSSKLVKLVKIIKLLKFTKLFLTFFTMILSVLAYSFMMGPWFAVCFVAILFVHEMGHVAALARRGYKASAPIFIPMLGAVIFAPKFKNADDEAYVGFGGPFIGGLSALVLFLFWKLEPHPSQLLLSVSYVAAFLNLFNLLPIRPLDGGRVTHIVGGWFKWLGVAGLLWFSLAIKQPALLLIWIIILQDIKLNPKLRVMIGASCQVAMVVLMARGYSDQPWLVDGVDITVASMMNGIYAAEAKRLIPALESEQPAVASPLQRAKWLVLYFLLLTTLVALMHIQHQYMPVAARR